jgi:hypothetical protein
MPIVLQSPNFERHYLVAGRAAINKNTMITEVTSRERKAKYVPSQNAFVNNILNRNVLTRNTKVYMAWSLLCICSLLETLY